MATNLRRHRSILGNVRDRHDLRRKDAVRASEMLGIGDLGPTGRHDRRIERDPEKYGIAARIEIRDAADSDIGACTGD